MAFQNELDTLRSFAKRFARKHQVPHHNALDIIAMQYGHLHWAALIKAWDKGWRPQPWELTDINESNVKESPVRAVGSVKTSEGTIAGEPYTVEVGFDYVLIGGDGWAVYLDHAPSKPPKIEVSTKTNPLENKAFFSEILSIGTKAVDEVRKAIAKDWGLASMQPDKDGTAKHPLFGGVSAKWHCGHCDTISTGSQMTKNMWHCPNCSATPLDMHTQAWWKEAASSTS